MITIAEYRYSRSVTYALRKAYEIEHLETYCFRLTSHQKY